MAELLLGDLDLEAMLQRALRPVDPPENLSLRLEQTLLSIADLAEQELDAWELSAMRDPKNWIPGVTRPVAAVAIGGVAGAALVVLQARARLRAGRR
ncbi:hypothetical protein NBH00_10070 [Paraconexibacter antarcticus]|uniref:DUF3618 domain-containing protein n=1 Tax=Paraconexibacter antarcticus TaxID=2949664 RepID=A0ABY5E113_9ACTN|nr:hypothetical protein [Paraconexibacter antarcticus]UTI66537.1 hypothetical protein NBH00_10070 [Paraconexibacter antarcticus]